MTTLLLCPDDLIVLAKRRKLTPQERNRLDQHLAQCALCRAAAATAEAVGRVPEVSGDDEQMALRLVGAVMKGGSGEVRRGRARKTVVMAAGFAAALLVAGVVGAAIAYWSGATHPAPVQPSCIVSGVASTPHLPSQFGVGATSAEASSSEAAPSSSAPVERAPVPRQVGASVSPSASVVSSPPLTADALFHQATQARGEGRTQDAVAAFVELQRRFAGSRQAGLSHYSLGELYLQSGQAAAAAQQFGAYLAGSGGGGLAEEALVRQARCYQMLGRGGEELRAWETLLARFPKSQYVWRANQRLEELRGARKP